MREGHDLPDPNDILVDDVYARAEKVKVGQKLHMLEHDFHLAGIVEHGKGARLFVMMSHAGGDVRRAGQGLGILRQVRRRITLPR